ncbi:MAG: type II toxin-antitoxin system RelE/ParE family toxin [Eubacteriales bacterium]
MYVEYEDHRVKELFEDLNNIQGSKNLMRRQIGTEMTKKVKMKYSQMTSFTNFAQLLESRIGKIESLVGEEKGTYSLRITKNYRLIVLAKSTDLSPEGLKKCDTFYIKGVIDYHGQGANNNWLIP